MAERNQNSYVLLRQFREFYVELARLRRMVEDSSENIRTASTELSALAAGSAGETALNEPSGTVALAVLPADAVTEEVWREMTRYLDRRMYEANAARGSLSHDMMAELVYIMAALADETFVCLLRWSGQDYWSDHLMELRLFHSQIAGQSIFQRIDRLLLRNDYGTEELIAVYLMVLSLGFKGQYQTQPEAVDAYRKRLFDRLHLSDSTFVRSGYRMFPEAYQHTVAEGSPVRLAEPRKWWGLVALIVVVWLMASTAAWLVLASTLATDLHATRQLVQAVSKEFSREEATSGSTYLFTRWNDSFQVALPPRLPSIDKENVQSIAPFFVIVQTAGTADPIDIQTWLSKATTSAGASHPAGSQPVLLAERVPAPYGMKAISDSVSFLVDPDLTENEVAAAAANRNNVLLTLPPTPPSGVTGVTLYLPGENQGSTP